MLSDAKIGDGLDCSRRLGSVFGRVRAGDNTVYPFCVVKQGTGSLMARAPRLELAGAELAEAKAMLSKTLSTRPSVRSKR